MKNDFDFIKDKIEESGVTAPGHMDERYVAQTLQGVEPKPDTDVTKPKKRFYKLFPAIAAAVVVVAAASVALGVHLSNLKGPLYNLKTVQTAGNLTLKQFSDYKEINSAVSMIRDFKSAYQNNTGWGLDGFKDTVDYGGSKEISLESGGASGSNTTGYSSTASSGGSSDDINYGKGSDSFSETYKQVNGVDEADIIKTDGRYIYCVDAFNSDTLKIFSAEGEDMQQVAVIYPSDYLGSVATDDEVQPSKAETEYYEADYSDVSIQEIYIKNNRLVAVCNDYRDGSNLTRVLVLDVSDMDDIVLLDHMTQSGASNATRMIGDVLYTVTTYYPEDNRAAPICDRGNTPEIIPADRVYSMQAPQNENFIIVSAYDTADFTRELEEKAILGGADTVYCNLSNMYITVARREFVVYEDYGLSDDLWPTGGNNGTSATQILKVKLSDGIDFAAYTEVEGTVDSQYSLDENNGYLRIATTSYNEDGDEVNNLYVLDSDLGEAGSVTGFAEDESIKAVRYVGDTAYVITYEQTDPLFVIDLSTPTAPEILGSVKIDGFSTMLVPLGDDMVLGLGYHTEDADYTDLQIQSGFKLVLFDVSDKTAPKVLDTAVYEDSYSEVMYNPKALVYNPERDDYIIPLNTTHYECEYYNTYSVGGMLNFSVRAGHLIEDMRYEGNANEDIERCVYVGDDIYMTHHDATDYESELEITVIPYE